MRKIISLLMVMVLTAGLCACSKPTDDASSVITEVIIIEPEISDTSVQSSEKSTQSEQGTLSNESTVSESNENSSEETSSVVVSTPSEDYDDISVKDYAYSFAVVGDTQYLVQNDVNWGVNNTATLYDWILKNKEPKKIKAVFGLGDITEKNDELQWQHAKANISKLNGVLPYYLVRGNHDNSNSFNKFFNNPEYTSQFVCADNADNEKCFYTAGKIENSYTKFSVGETKYLLIMLDFCPDDNVLDWANEVVVANPDCRVIVTTHDYLAYDGSWDTEKPTPESNSGRDVWIEFVRNHKNIFLVLCGHENRYPNSDILMLQSKGNKGNTVTQLMINPQSLEWDNIYTTDDDYDQQYGMVAMLYFSEDGSRVWVEYISTVLSNADGDYLYRNVNQFDFYTRILE